PARRGKVFRLSRNERSRWPGNGVHVEPESVFMISRNMHFRHMNKQTRRHLRVRGFMQRKLQAHKNHSKRKRTPALSIYWLL
ncbi:hypothetical protein, partial [Aeromonas veronii]|uniref:hypothetical protein n=1 Tax=Aeromonas veronii TaxID=654 RepID=UPI0039F669C2